MFLTADMVIYVVRNQHASQELTHTNDDLLLSRTLFLAADHVIHGAWALYESSAAGTPRTVAADREGPSQ